MSDLDDMRGGRDPLVGRAPEAGAGDPELEPLTSEPFRTLYATIFEALEQRDHELRTLHHARMRVDANARAFISEVAARAVATLMEEAYRNKETKVAVPWEDWAQDAGLWERVWMVPDASGL